jgi:hypothetical protein
VDLVLLLDVLGVVAPGRAASHKGVEQRILRAHLALERVVLGEVRVVLEQLGLERLERRQVVLLGLRVLLYLDLAVHGPVRVVAPEPVVLFCR